MEGEIDVFRTEVSEVKGIADNVIRETSVYGHSRIEQLVSDIEQQIDAFQQRCASSVEQLTLSEQHMRRFDEAYQQLNQWLDGQKFDGTQYRTNLQDKLQLYNECKVNKA